MAAPPTHWTRCTPAGVESFRRLHPSGRDPARCPTPRRSAQNGGKAAITLCRSFRKDKLYITKPSSAATENELIQTWHLFKVPGRPYKFRAKSDNKA
ncbi:uncharacterized protein RHO17_001052 isoform 2-T2 [Thomomys bottae]